MHESKENSNLTDPIKLYMPKYAILEFAIRECESIPDGAKIYFGELAVLANKYGYVGYQDSQLAEMKGKSKGCIERWHTALEKEGFITRETKNVPYTSEDGNLRWRTERKMFIHQVPKKIIAEPTKEVAEPTELLAPNGTNKNGGLIKQEENKMLASSSSSEVDSSLIARIKLLDGLGLDPGQCRTIANRPYADIVAAIDHMRRSREEITNVFGWLCDCLKKRYWEAQPLKQASSQHPSSAPPSSKQFQSKAWIALYNAIAALHNDKRPFEWIIPSEWSIRAHRANMEVFIDKTKIQNQNDLLEQIKKLNQFFINTGLNFKARYEIIGDEKDINITIEE